MQLKDLIKECPGLGELISEYEIRLSNLENGQLNTSVLYENIQTMINKTEPKLPELPWSCRQWDFVQQLLARLIHLESKVDKLILTKKKIKGRY